MDSGAGYHICSFKTENYIKRGTYHEQRNFCKASPAASVQSCEKYSDVMNEVDIASLLSGLTTASWLLLSA